MFMLLFIYFDEYVLLVINMLNSGSPGAPVSPHMENPAVRAGVTDFAVYTLRLGFQKQGTYTRIEDHRIMLVANEAMVTPMDTEGCARPETITVLRGIGKLTFNWSAGLRFFSDRDPLEAANQIYDYVKKYASTPQAEKSKPTITYAAQVEHLLGCELIDLFLKSEHFRTRDAGQTFYLNPDKQLPDDFIARCPVLVQMAARAATKIRPAKSHFRVYFHVGWRQLTGEDKRRKLLRKILMWIAILGFILAVTNFVLRLAGI